MNRTRGRFGLGGRSAHVGILENLEPRRLLAANLVADVGGIYPTNAISIDGISYFAADDGVHGRELWRSDGTQAGTQMVVDLTPGAESSEVFGIRLVNDRLIFGIRTVDDPYGSLWRSDGTAEGTVEIGIVAPSGTDQSMPSAVINGKLIFLFNGVQGEMSEWSIWVSDGTAEGTEYIKWFEYVGEYADHMSVLGDIAMFVANDGKMWATDGTREGTYVIFRGWDEGGIRSTVVSDDLVLSTDGALWKTDGTPSSKQWVSDVDGSHFVSFGDLALYEHHDESSTWLAVTDGTTDGTKLITQPSDAAWRPSMGAALGETFLLPAMQSSPLGWEIWRTDGTTAGTSVVKGFPASGSDLASSFVTVLDQTYFLTRSLNGEMLLWQSDGTAEGTQVVQAVSQEAGGLKEINGKLVILSGSAGNSSVVSVYDPSVAAGPIGPAQGSISLKDGVLRIHGTQGDDSIRIYHHTSAVDRFVVNLNGVKQSFALAGVSRIYIYGYSGNDNLSFYDGYGRVSTRSRIWGGAGNDSIYTGLNRDTLYGDAGADNLNSGANDDILMGGDGDDLVNAGFGNDTAGGEGGSDHVNGGAGSDMVSGGSDGSQDWIDGGVGADVLFGQAVIDTFFNFQSGSDISLAEDLLQS